MKKWWIWGTIFYVHAVALFYKGVSQFEDYYMADNTYEDSVNAFVGGDAYNYIINASLQTGWFVLSAMFFISGTMFIVTGSILKAIKEKKIDEKKEEAVA
jgi:uncharacterized membrane protein YbaN (DUF454 family)